MLQGSRDMYGTRRGNGKGLPSKFGAVKPKKGEMRTFQRGKAMVLKWQEKKTICALSTVHNPSSCKVKSNKGDDMIKPQLICDYSHKMAAMTNMIKNFLITGTLGNSKRSIIVILYMV